MERLSGFARSIAACALVASLGLATSSAWADTEDPYKFVVLSPDAKKIAVATWKTVDILDVESGAAVASLADVKNVNAVAFSRDGSRVAVGCERGTVKVFDAASGKLVVTMKGPNGAVAFSPDGSRIAGGAPLEVSVWDATNGKRVAKIKTDGVRSVAFSPDGKLLALGGDKVEFVDAAAGGEPQGASGSRSAAMIAWSPDGTKVVGASMNGNFYVVDAASKAIATKRYENDSEHKASGIAIGADGATLFVRTTAGVDVLELPSLTRKASLEVADTGEAFSFNAEKKVIAYALKNQAVKLVSFDGSEAKVVKTLQSKAAAQAGAKATLCGSDEYKAACTNQTLKDYYWKVCMEASRLDRNNEAKVKEWGAAARKFPAALEAYTKFKEKWETCYSDNHNCENKSGAESCLKAGDQFKEAFKSLVEGVKTDVEQAKSRAAQSLQSNSFDSARMETTSADKWLAQLVELNQIDFIKTDVGGIQSMVDEMKKSIGGDVTKAVAKEEEKWKPFTSVLKGDRLAFFNDNHRRGTNVWGKGKTLIRTPSGFKKASLMCYYTIDRNGVTPRWETTCFKFKGNKKGSPTIRNGWGDSPPSKAFR
ncbi:MAG: PD40 domain-containing protein [Deltaproteobacteria bacterium]|nr:PD40 domain-containing protein [Deltaproteobacteria bacterium]